MSNAPKIKKKSNAGRKPLANRDQIKVRVEMHVEGYRVKALGGKGAAAAIGKSAIEQATKASS